MNNFMLDRTASWSAMYFSVSFDGSIVTISMDRSTGFRLDVSASLGLLSFACWTSNIDKFSCFFLSLALLFLVLENYILGFEASLLKSTNLHGLSLLSFVEFVATAGQNYDHPLHISHRRSRSESVEGDEQTVGKRIRRDEDVSLST